MPKINVYLPDALAEAVRDAKLPVSAICQGALERAVRDVTSARGSDEPPAEGRPGIGFFSRFTPRARQAMALAELAAANVPHDFIGTEHVLLGVIDEGTNLALKILASLEVEADDLRSELVASMAKATDISTGALSFTPVAKLALELTAKEAMTLGHNYIGCEHLLLGLLAAEDGLASQVMRRMGLELRTARRAVIGALIGLVHATQAAPTPPPARDTDATLAEILRRLDAIEERLAG